MKKTFLLFWVGVFLSAFLSITSLADDDVEDKFYKAAKKALKERDQLRLNDSQVKQIKALLADVKKTLIRQDADIKALKVEINTLMWESPLELDKTNALVADKYDLKKKKAQYLVSSMDRLNKILTPDQRKKLY